MKKDRKATPTTDNDPPHLQFYTKQRTCQYMIQTFTSQQLTCDEAPADDDKNGTKRLPFFE
uniref:CUB domain-containing protein n=1 Tax=Heterorhabditis bacteriophora TaxID=37862 RepID=A0A1I7XHW3_HETBA